jgi:hypothetical protein
VIRRISLAGVTGVLVASGAYALIYLFRWEWHRAIITALFFVAAEIGLGISILLRRMAGLEQRLDRLEATSAPAAPLDADPAVLARIQEAAPAPSKPFAWLEPGSGITGVFLPFLLGVGALASGLAWLVEQLARRTTAPVLERRLARSLAPLSLPAGGLLGTAPSAPAPAVRRVRPGGLALSLVAFVLVLGFSVATIDWLGDALQTRPDHRTGGVATLIEVELRGARSTAGPEAVAATLWGTCSHVLHGANGPTTIEPLGGTRVRVVVANEIGEHAEERLRGCLQDAVVDRVQASVRRWEAIPPG